MTAPRAASTSSANCSAIDCGAMASVASTPATSIPVTVVRMPVGKTCTSSPTRTVPEDDPAGDRAVVAVALRERRVGGEVGRRAPPCGRSTSCTGRRNAS